ncbi:MAG: hypothetical protein JHC82_06520 [Stenotrophomonas sp.]|jgi:hypothetical protein|nr:hypothetical protein [Stenotrophomonas sp.]
MVILVQNISPHWRLVHPRDSLSRDFPRGREAFDAAAALALEHHGRTGAGVTVQVGAFGEVVDALRLG